MSLSPDIEGMLERIAMITGFSTDQIVLQSLLHAFPQVAEQVADYVSKHFPDGLPSYVMLEPEQVSKLTSLSKHSSREIDQFISLIIDWKLDLLATD